MKKIIMTLALTIFLVGCGMEKEPIEQTIDTANRAQNLADARTVESIISEVELAYSSAYMSSGNYPTIEQIVDKFYMDGIEMDKNGNIKMLKINTATINTLATNITNDIQQELYNLENTLTISMRSNIGK